MDVNADTTFGKGLKTLLWLVFSNALVFAATQISGHPNLYNPQIVSLANLASVVIKNFIDPTVKNI